MSLFYTIKLSDPNRCRKINLFLFPIMSISFSITSIPFAILQGRILLYKSVQAKFNRSACCVELFQFILHEILRGSEILRVKAKSELNFRTFCCKSQSQKTTSPLLSNSFFSSGFQFCCTISFSTTPAPT
jgi:hypothetical protein